MDKYRLENQFLKWIAKLRTAQYVLTFLYDAHGSDF